MIQLEPGDWEGYINKLRASLDTNKISETSTTKADLVADNVKKPAQTHTSTGKTDQEKSMELSPTTQPIKCVTEKSPSKTRPLMTQQQPAIVCLQETFLKTDDDITIKTHQSYNFINNNNNGHRASGGVSILIRNCIPQSKTHLNTQLQAIAVKVTLHRTINICSIYIPPQDAINESEINNILQQLPTPFILLGDFNSHNTMWCCRNTNSKTKLSKISLTIIISAYSTKNHQYTWIIHLQPTQPLI